MNNLRKNCLALTALIMACGAASKATAQTNAAPMSDSDQIKALEKRVAELESKSATTGGTNAASLALGWLEDNHISGFVSVSYLHNFNHQMPTTGRSFDVNDGFTINKFKLALEHPVDYSSDKWDAGYRADLIAGQDATLIQSAGPTLGTFGDVEQLFATVNVPIGRGLLVRVGKQVTLMGVEVIEETANPTWSEGNQFLFAENFTSTGAEFSYKWSDKIDTQLRINNGWDVIKDNNTSVSYMGRIGYTMDDKTSFGLVPYGGPEEAGNNSAWRYGVNFVANRKITEKLTAWGQLDYGHEQANAALPKPGDAEWYAGGLWLTYDFTEKIGVATRVDYFRDADGARTSGAVVSAAGNAIGTPFPINTGQDLSSFTFTLNLKPVPKVQFRPEIRVDHSSLAGAYGGRRNQVTAGFSLAYLF